MNLGPVIRRLREEKGWSQEELAHRVSTSAANLSRIENGKHGASNAMLTSIARALGHRVFELYALADGIAVGNLTSVSDLLGKDEELLLNRYRKMSPLRKELVLQLSFQLADERQ